MTDPDLVLHLRDSLERQVKALAYLSDSLEDCSSLKEDGAMTSRELASYEALASRFARASDMLINKVFRAIDALEFYESGSPLDVLNRADKRGLIDDFEAIRQIRRVRNRIAHEYNIEDFPKFMNDIRTLSKSLFVVFQRTQAYAEQFFASPGTGGK